MRKLNLDEKRRLEKMMFADIEKGIENYKSVRAEQKDKLVENLNENIPAAILKAYKDYKKAKTEMEAKENYIEQKGYRVEEWRNECEVKVSSYSNQPAELTSFDKETIQTEKRLEALKRKFAIRLYAGGIEEIHALFGDITKELKAITKV